MFAIVLHTLLNMNPSKCCSTYKYFYAYQVSNLHSNIMYYFKLSDTILENFNHTVHNLLCISIVQCMEVQLLITRSNEGYIVRLEIFSPISLEIVVLSLEWLTDSSHTQQCKYFCMYVSTELLV